MVATEDLARRLRESCEKGRVLSPIRRVVSGPPSRRRNTIQSLALRGQQVNLLGLDSLDVDKDIKGNFLIPTGSRAIRKSSRLGFVMLKTAGPPWSQGTLKCKDKEYVYANAQLPIEKYAVRFLEYDHSADGATVAEAQTTLERMSDLGNLSMSWADLLSEDNLFYTVLSGAMELLYRTSIDSHTNSVDIFKAWPNIVGVNEVVSCDPTSVPWKQEYPPLGSLPYGCDELAIDLAWIDHLGFHRKLVWIAMGYDLSL
ncbi:hypothetical protein QJS10_CPB19g01419 [Acorus calamus]|uniref:Uncharacterized protein n=1 Tax=Acorus calamus TaxID=4465 RepID=A0AAV9CI57_ACOCL|nr:hypothetical protein QJS10_CPB19g01419 [Acorus calamus]